MKKNKTKHSHKCVCILYVFLFRPIPVLLPYFALNITLPLPCCNPFFHHSERAVGAVMFRRELKEDKRAVWNLLASGSISAALWEPY